MTSETAQIIMALGMLISALASSTAVILGAFNARTIRDVKVLGEKTHEATNSKMDRLLAVTEKAAEARGLKQGQDESRA